MNGGSNPSGSTVGESVLINTVPWAGSPNPDKHGGTDMIYILGVIEYLFTLSIAYVPIWLQPKWMLWWAIETNENNNRMYEWMDSKIAKIRHEEKQVS